MSLNICRYAGIGLSRYRTFNVVENYAEVKTPQDVIDAFLSVKESGLKAFVLGGGSNVFFKNRNVKSFIIKNSLPQNITFLDNDRFEVSSSVRMLDLLNYLLKLKRDTFWYLASAPCEIGGAIAMNAGTGKKEGKSVFDFVESVSVIRNCKILKLNKDEISRDFRHSEFMDSGDFILSAVFRFPEVCIDGNPIADRLRWANANQDLGVPNCGSLCDEYNAGILRFLRAIFSILPAGLSKKKLNWGRNESKNPIWFSSFLTCVKLLHKILGKKLKFEIKTIE